MDFVVQYTNKLCSVIYVYRWSVISAKVSLTDFYQYSLQCIYNTILDMFVIQSAGKGNCETISYSNMGKYDIPDMFFMQS